MKNTLFFLLLLTVICSLGCQDKIKESSQVKLDEQKDHVVTTYKSVNGILLQLHMFYPGDLKKEERRPAIAFFHGGGWTIGNYSWAFNNARHYSSLGMIGIAVQYRLSNRKDITPVDAMQDAKDVFLWLRTHADSLGIDPDKIAGEGWSAGGHLVVSTAVFADILPNRINSVPNALILKSPALDKGRTDRVTPTI